MEPHAYQAAQPDDVEALRRVASALGERRYHYNFIEDLCKDAHVTSHKLHRLTVTLGLLTAKGRYCALSRRGEEVLER
jgi:hypothetical protein